MSAANLLEIERLNRLYSALSQVNQAIVRTRTRDDLFRKVCDVLVEQGGFRMAWVGWHDPSTQRLMPVAHAGDDGGYLESVQVYADDRSEGRGPSGHAFRADRPYICNDTFDDPVTRPWRTELEQHGFRALAAFPIRANGAVVGTLAIYAMVQGVFRDKEISLLTEAASDISFALDNLAREETRERAEEIVKRFAAIVESTDDAIVSKTVDGVITSWNPAAERIFGYSAAEIVGRSIGILIPADRADEGPFILGRVRRGERITQFETVRLRKDGTLFPVSITVSPIWAPDDVLKDSVKIIGVSKIIRDITERKRVEALADSEQRFASSLIEAMPGVFYLYDEQGRFLRWNRNLERVSGYSAEEIAQIHPLDLFSSEERPLLEKRIAEVFEKGEASVEASLVSKEGRVVPYLFTGRRVVLDGLPRLVGVGIDMAERRRAEEAVKKSEERYRTTLDTMLEGCQLLGSDWRYLYLNRAAAIHNRRPNAEILGRTMLEAWPGIEASNIFALLRPCMEERVPVRDETEFVFADGSSAWFDVRAQPVPEGIFVLSIDISKRKRGEKALRELNETLERKVAERTHDLEVARERAEAADRIKSAFLASMSHELRTPLNSILGFTGIVLKGMAGPLTAEQSKQLGMVQGSSRHLLDLINDVLDISKIEAGQLEVRCAPFALRASVERVTALLMPVAAKKGLTVQVAVSQGIESMESDQRRVEQILLNLLNNAIKFTERGSVRLEVDVIDEPETHAANQMRSMARIRISDTGIGMKQEDLSKLFQPFRQLDSGLQREHEGTGLGLAICRRLTGLLGGTIGVESAPGRGSLFTVLLPTTRSSKS
jgi:PAS domain S-box-containing protein